MKKLLHIVLGVLLLALPSCENPFTLDQEGQPRIYLQCIADTQDVHLSPRYASAVGGPAGALQDLQIDLRVNGEPVPVKALEGGDYYGNVVLKEGDRVQVRMQAAGVDAVEGYSVMPAAPVVKDVNLENVQADTIKATRVSLTLDHAPGEGEYFGIQILSFNVVHYLDGTSDGFHTYLTPGYYLTAAESVNMDLEDFMQVNYYGMVLGGRTFAPLTLVTQKQFDGPVYSFYLNSFDATILDRIRGSMPGGSTGVAGGGIVSGEVGGGTGSQPLDPGKTPVGMDTRYYVFLSRLSPECYHYARALYQSNFDFLSNMGLTPANFTWSNVSGGLGFVGAMATAQLPVIEIPKEN